MTYPVWPSSPAPADFTFEPVWASDDTRYESGGGQSATTYFKPLYEYTVNYQNAQGAKVTSLEAFWNLVKGHVTPWFWTDPRSQNHYVTSADLTTIVASRRLYRFYTQGNSWRCIPASGAFTFRSTLSGALTQGVHYAFSQDNGTVTIFSASVNSSDSYSWNGTYFKKVRFDRNFRPSSRIWDNYQFSLEFYEVGENG